MATTNFYLVKVLDEKIIPFVEPIKKGPLDNLVLSQNDLASLRNAGWDVINVRPLPETAKIKYDYRSIYNKVKGEEGKFINVPFYINPIDTRKVIDLLEFNLVNNSTEEVVKTYNPKELSSSILSIPTSILDINEEYRLELKFRKNASEGFTLADPVGYQSFFQRVFDKIYIKVVEYGKFTGRLVQLEQDITVYTESVLPLEKFLGYKDFDTEEINAVEEEKLTRLVHVNVSNPRLAKYEKDKNRLFFYGTEGKIQVKVFENGIQDNIVNFNINIVKPETLEKQKDRGYSFNLYNKDSNNFEKIKGEVKVADPNMTEGEVAEPTSPVDDEKATVPTGSADVEINSNPESDTTTRTEVPNSSATE